MKNYIVIAILAVISFQNYTSFKILPLTEILKKNPEINYKQSCRDLYFDFNSFSLSSLVPSKGYFKECFILEIPNGTVQGKEGLVFFNNEFIQEMAWADRYEFLKNISCSDINKVLKIPGRVAVVAQVASDNYCHFFYEILARIGMLEMYGIEYDWLYLSCERQFIVDALKLWGIDQEKIIFATDNNACIQADTLILPSLVLNTNNGFKHTGVNAHPVFMRYVREKLLSKINGDADHSKFSKKIFISRRDAPSRRILNEDEIFEFFKVKGFERYDTGSMSVAEQIALFAQAEMVVGEHGAGLTNILFCPEGCKVIELFQALIDSSFWFPAQIFNLDYIPVNTLNVDGNVFYNWQEINPNIYYQAMLSQVKIPLDQIEQIVDNLDNSFVKLGNCSVRNFR